MSLLAIRFVFWVGAAVGVLALAYVALDAYGDYRVSKERALFAKAIDDVNVVTAAEGDVATLVLLRDERLRAAAVAAFKATLKPSSQCLLSPDEASSLARIR